MSTAIDLAAAAGSTDPKVGLRAVLALRRLLESLEAVQVDNARLQGWSWQEIADALEVTRQGVHKKHANRMPMNDPREG
jgi:DNA-directed RNA polymerase specialized sigma24 family protein